MSAEDAAAMRKEWGAALRRRREERQLTQDAVAELAGVDQASVSRAESGTGSVESIIRIAQKLDLVIAVTA